MVKVIGICGLSGSGKTALTKKLGEALQATTIFWDDYDEICSGPRDYVKWFETSRDYSAWKYDSLSKVLAKLKAQEKIECPATLKTLNPTPYIIFDSPLGYKHLSTGKYIDKLIYIDVPLDIALARRILRDYKGEENSKKLLLEEIKYYLDFSRKVYLCASEIQQGCHLMINGESSLNEQVQFTIASLNLKPSDKF